MKHLLIAVMLGSLAACASAGGAGSGSSNAATAAEPEVPAMASPSLSVTGQPQARLQAGRALFSARCQRCHALPDPNRLSPDKWPAQITVMSRKSGLSSDQIALVTDYVVAASRSHN